MNSNIWDVNLICSIYARIIVARLLGLLLVVDGGRFCFVCLGTACERALICSGALWCVVSL